MAPISLFTALLAAAPLVHGHYSFIRLKTNGVWHEPLQYIRNKTSPFDEKQFVDSNFLWRYYNWPTYFLDFPDSVRCGRGNLDHAKETQVLTIKAGDEVEIAHLRSDPSEWDNGMFECADDRGACDHRPYYRTDFNHPGPLIIHLSKVPEGQDIKTYDGSGEWVKIHSRGLVSAKERPIKWELYVDEPPHLKFKIPAQTPPGQYLMRMDVLMAGMLNKYIKIGELGSFGQMYPTCAQLNILSQSTAQLPQGVLIPEIFAPEAPGMTHSSEMQHFQSIDEGYRYPGGPRWTGEEVVEDIPI
ncbi:glycosyl hydrolase family 61-domain-containing protein [Podospora australis]|uniref:lytic cellulose monooxygenase (C4-dehydrogenating) n=1 Tax=Podospora australis TaxID=1536484 RepID=A0AAN6WIB0_9PEZI|nr:glycosyl hydrolase family 61-domain-containing protein [Podospora australis]